MIQFKTPARFPARFAGASFAALALTACVSPELNVERPMIEAHDTPMVAGTPTPWTSLEALDADAQFHFIVVTDRTGSARPGVWEDAMAKINLMQPAFVVSVGDLIQGGTEDLDQLDLEWTEFDGLVDRLEPPFFYAAGNHDYSNTVMSEVWEERLGRSYYAFSYKDALFVVLNSSLFNTTDAPADWVADHDQQMAWLDETLDEHDDARWTYLFMHYPFWRDFWWRTLEPNGGWTGDVGRDPTNTGNETWAQIELMLADRDYTAFAGHTHTYEYEADTEGRHTHERIALATTGGGTTTRQPGVDVDGERRMTLLGPEMGELDHFVWVTMTDDGPVIANVLLDGVLGKDFDHFFKQPALNADEAED